MYMHQETKKSTWLNIIVIFCFMVVVGKWICSISRVCLYYLWSACCVPGMAWRILNALLCFLLPVVWGGKHMISFLLMRKLGTWRVVTCLGSQRWEGWDLNPGTCTLHCERSHFDLLRNRTLFALYTCTYAQPILKKAVRSHHWL